MLSLLEKINKQKNRDLLNDHRNLLFNHLTRLTDIQSTTKTRILNYYDTQINIDNIEHYYHLHITHFLQQLLT